MQVVKIQILLIILGAIITHLVGANSVAYILGCISVAIPTFIHALCWEYIKLMKRNLSIMMISHLLKIFWVLLILFLVIKQQQGSYMAIMAGFIISCKAYLLAGLSLKKR